MVSPRYKSRLFHGPWRDPVRMHRNQYMCGAMWDVEHSVAMASLDIYKTTQMNKRCKVWEKKNWFQIKNKTEHRGQSIPKSIGTLTVLRCIFGPNLEILTIGILTKVFYTCGPNLVILAWTGDVLSRGQTWWRTDGRTDGLIITHAPVHINDFRGVHARYVKRRG